MHELIEPGAYYNITTTRQIGGLFTSQLQSVFMDVNGNVLALITVEGTVINWGQVVVLQKVKPQPTGDSTNGNRRMSAL